MIQMILRVGLWDWSTHHLDSKEDPVLSRRLNINSPWHKAMTQLLKILLVVARTLHLRYPHQGNNELLFHVAMRCHECLVYFFPGYAVCA